MLLSNIFQQKFPLLYFDEEFYADFLPILLNDKLSNIQTGSRPDVNLREKYFKNSDVVKVSEILNKISESNHPLNKLAQHLKSFANINNTNIFLTAETSYNISPRFLTSGYYDVTNNVINIAEFANVRNGQSETLLLHEILHALSYVALRKNNNFNKDFQKLYNHSIEQLGNYTDNLSMGPYANYDIDEFFVALFTDAKFITQLKELAPIDVKNYKNLFEELIDVILNVLGLSKGNSIYNQAFAIASNMLQEQNETKMSFEQLDQKLSQEYDFNNYAFESFDNEDIKNRLQYEAENNLNKPEGLPGISRTSTECS